LVKDVVVSVHRTGHDPAPGLQIQLLGTGRGVVADRGAGHRHGQLTLVPVWGRSGEAASRGWRWVWSKSGRWELSV
jgi:hypothetical protein